MSGQGRISPRGRRGHGVVPHQRWTMAERMHKVDMKIAVHQHWSGRCKGRNQTALILIAEKRPIDMIRFQSANLIISPSILRTPAPRLSESLGAALRQTPSMQVLR
jgi:hypothetical protein